MGNEVFFEVWDKDMQGAQLIGATELDLANRIEAKIAARADAKAGKDWAAADAIRDELTSMGIAIKDGPDGTTWTRIVE